MMTVAQEKSIYMDASWLEKLKEEFEKPYMKNLEAFLAQEFSKGMTVYPPVDLIFNAFCHTTFQDTKVVIMGQDPYHGPKQAQGLSFSVSKEVPIPPSLQNIYKELNADIGFSIPNHGCLFDWAKQGVLLLNATLTVRESEPKSHFKQGWETFTDKVIELLSQREDSLVFILWGKSAYEKFQHIAQNTKHHLILTSPHPSPLSAHAGFFGCHHFSKTNAFLKSVGKTPINWTIKP